jgi:hypothetical protein
MPTNTYTPLATITLTGTDSEVVFASIPSGYRDLVFSISILGTSNDQSCVMQLNADTGANYSNVRMAGWGASYGSNTTGTTYIFVSGYNYGLATSGAPTIAQGSILDYSATDKHKSTLIRSRSSRDNGDGDTAAGAGRWANTAAVTSVKFYLTGGSFIAGSTFSLFGVAA